MKKKNVISDPCPVSRELDATAYEPPEWQPARIAPVARIKQFHPRCTVKLWTQHQGRTVRIRGTRPQDEMWLGGNPECGAAQYAVIHPEDIFDARVNSLCEHQFLTD